VIDIFLFSFLLVVVQSQMVVESQYSSTFSSGFASSSGDIGSNSTFASTTGLPSIPPPKSSSLVILLTTILSGSLLVVVAILGVVLHRKRMREKAFRATSKDLLRTKETSKFDEIPVLRNMKIIGEIGGGRFGQVYLADWEGSKVAAKKLTSEDFAEFEKEAIILFHLNHPNVVHFLGRFSDDDGSQYLVLEYMSKGSLKDELRKESLNLTNSDLLDMIIESCRGMVFLSSRNVIHRDLGVRNLLCSLVDGKYVVKISDFGLSRPLNRHRSFRTHAPTDDVNPLLTEVYAMNSETNFPVKWSAPEVINRNFCSTMSDVWSFGIVMWEILSFGAEPYDWLSLKDAAIEIPKGARLPRPSHAVCPVELWELMQSCWQVEVSKRPTFKNLYESLENIRQDEQKRTVESVTLVIEVPKIDRPQVTSPYDD